MTQPGINPYQFAMECAGLAAVQLTAKGAPVTLWLDADNTERATTAARALLGALGVPLADEDGGQLPDPAPTLHRQRRATRLTCGGA